MEHGRKTLQPGFCVCVCVFFPPISFEAKSKKANTATNLIKLRLIRRGERGLIFVGEIKRHSRLRADSCLPGNAAAAHRQFKERQSKPIRRNQLPCHSNSFHPICLPVYPTEVNNLFERSLSVPALFLFPLCFPLSDFLSPLSSSLPLISPAVLSVFFSLHTNTPAMVRGAHSGENYRNSFKETGRLGKNKTKKKLNSLFIPVISGSILAARRTKKEKTTEERNFAVFFDKQCVGLSKLALTEKLSTVLLGHESKALVILQAYKTHCFTAAATNT